ncbi:hypothetical protein [Azospirillum halopraeferens]|uniref:hypothetical protein n=1 Tax=Azospirillum halopraeferens TaxID=34010 RepID=UPI00048F416F|nr:hypothetical protein [Azospirillum halopraeferens]
MDGPLVTLSALNRLARSRALAYGASAALLVAFGAAGASVFPFATGMPENTGVYRPPQPVTGLLPDKGIPVYDLLGEVRTRRSGIASMDEGGYIRVARYDRTETPADRPEPVLLAANVRTLWVLATDADRAELRETAAEFVAAARVAIEGALASPVFAREYKPVLEDSVARAFSEAWNAPATRDAAAAVLRIGQPMFRGVVADDLRPALLERLTPAIWEAARGSAANLLEVFSRGFTLDLVPLEEAVAGALADERVRKGATDAVAALAATPQARHLAEVMATELVHRLRTDDLFTTTLGNLFGDSRFSAYLAPVGPPALQLARAAPRTLARLEEKADLNSLAADIFKSQARGLSGYVIIYMTPEQRDRIAAIDPLAPVTLGTVTPAAAGGAS